MQHSLTALTSDPDALAASFYRELFALEPATRRLFHGDMREQGRKFALMLAHVGNHLDRFDALLPTLRELGARHAGYQVTPGHYAIVERALLVSFAKTLGRDFTPRLRTAWTRAYRLLARVMIEAANDVAPTQNERGER